MQGPVTRIRRQTFRKLERLVSRKTIEQLMASGQSLQVAAFRLVWLKTTLSSPYPVQVAFSVPKRNFKKAVERNRIKRMMREVYRKNKSIVYPLLTGRKEQYAILIIYTGRSVPAFGEVDQKLTLTLKRFSNEIEKNPV
jgi:ribonuclease P protein component